MRDLTPREAAAFHFLCAVAVVLGCRASAAPARAAERPSPPTTTEGAP